MRRDHAGNMRTHLGKKTLLEGLDEIGLTRLRKAEIAVFQQKDRARRPWVYV